MILLVAITFLFNDTKMEFILGLFDVFNLLTKLYPK